MHLAVVPARRPLETLPVWPPLLATRGRGARSEGHTHHAMHLVMAIEGELRVRDRAGPWMATPGVLTAPDVAHAIDGHGLDVLLVFLDPESDVGRALRATVAGSMRRLSVTERDALVREARPEAILRAEGAAWTRRVVDVLGGVPCAPARTIHPRVRTLLRSLRAMPPDADTSLEALAAGVGLSPGRLMHAFTTSIGIPLRPYLTWLKLQRAASGIVMGVSLSDAAHAAGFSDAAHMSRTFRRMLGMPPSALRPSNAAS